MVDNVEAIEKMSRGEQIQIRLNNIEEEARQLRDELAGLLPAAEAVAPPPPSSDGFSPAEGPYKTPKMPAESAKAKEGRQAELDKKGHKVKKKKKGKK